MNIKLFKIIFLIVFSLIGISMLLPATGRDGKGSKRQHKVLIAFGFHVNLYHSFRNDTNDDYGFGQDIKVIRHIIRTLDRFNDLGVPVKAVWDFDNLFSLQERLPQHAPDIIHNIQKRVKNRGDEVILMSYNNGLVSAMTRKEFSDAMQWAVSNPWGSGVKDLFGRYSPIVRPQEMMTTPGHFALYRQQGIQAVSLYYSATPFDAFRVFASPLSRTEAYNPITYKHPQTQEEMTIIPTYNIGDLLENVSLRHWVERLHHFQKNGEIDHDVLIYINYDADSEFWRGLDLSWPLNQLPNTNGLAGLVDEVKDIDFVRFTTLGDYLKSHPPVGTVFFGQDTADGSFDGYNSWAEKAGSHHYWTRLEDHRRTYLLLSKAVEMMDNQGLKQIAGSLMDELYLKRMRALSTTNFGMATPFLAPEREYAVESLFREMDKLAYRLEKLVRSAAGKHFQSHVLPGQLPEEWEWLDTLLLVGMDETSDGRGGNFLNVRVPNQYDKDHPLFLMKPDGKVVSAKVIHSRRAVMETGTWLKLYFPQGDALEDGIHYLVSGPQAIHSNHSPAVSDHLKNDKLELRFDANGMLAGVYLKGIQKLESGSLNPYIRYRDRLIRPAQLKKIAFSSGPGVSSLQLHGAWQGPANETLSTGAVDYHFALVDELPYLFVDGQIRYPLTRQKDLFKSHTPALAHKLDLGWQEVAPMELRLAHRATIHDPVRIIKYNFLGLESSYLLDYFNHSPENLSLDNINNHITAAYCALVAGGHGLAIGMDTQVLANFAFAPVKVRYDDGPSVFAVQANPFGTYHGRQYRHPTWGNRLGYELSLMAGEQFHSAGPTYNGISTSFAVMLAFFDGQKMPVQIKQDLINYARPQMVLSLNKDADDLEEKREYSAPSVFEALHIDDRIYFRWEPKDPRATHYRVYCGTLSDEYKNVFTTAETSLMVDRFPDGQKIEMGRTYYAAVEAVGADGAVLNRSSEIAVDLEPARQTAEPRSLSLGFQIKVLWANISAIIGRYAIYMRSLRTWNQICAPVT